MGMYDEYEPVPQPRCPWCEAGFSTHWQGKDGPNLLLVWRQGERHPVDQSIDEDARMERERYAEFVLPEQFTILGECDNGHFVTARGRCVGGVWRELDYPRSGPRSRRRLGGTDSGAGGRRAADPVAGA
jgi:hypothetical protein